MAPRLPRCFRHELRQMFTQPGVPPGSVAGHGPQNSRTGVGSAETGEQEPGFFIGRLRDLSQESNQQVAQMKPQRGVSPQTSELVAIGWWVACTKEVQCAPESRPDEQGLLFLVDDVISQ